MDLATNRFRSGGYAACDAEDQLPDSRLPPTCCSREVCEHVNSARQASEGCRPGVQRKVVNFWTWAPKAHIGNVITAQESRF
eukprot:733876-Pleurochrysis_carterae.AAC.1